MQATLSPPKAKRTRLLAIEDDPDSQAGLVLRDMSIVGDIARQPQTDDLPIAPHATTARAGSLEKLTVMRQRVEAGYSPFHPDDNPLVEVQAVRRYFPGPEKSQEVWE